MITEAITQLITLHPAAYNPNTESLYLEVIMGMCALVAIGATIFVKEFILRK